TAAGADGVWNMIVTASSGAVTARSVLPSPFRSAAAIAPVGDSPGRTGPKGVSASPGAGKGESTAGRKRPAPFPSRTVTPKLETARSDLWSPLRSEAAPIVAAPGFAPIPVPIAEPARRK